MLGSLCQTEKESCGGRRRLQRRFRAGKAEGTMSRELRLDKDGMQKHLRGKDYLADAMGQIMLNSISAMAGQMTFFYTNKVGMAAAAVATLLLLAKIVDAVTDLFMGKIVDKTNTPEGKARPWLRRMIIPGALSIILLFTVPAGAGSFRYVYAFLTNIFASAICYTAIAVPYYTMMNYQTRSSEEKGKLGTFRAAVGYAVGVGLGIGLMPITGALGDDQRAWVILACCMSVISALGLFTAYRGTREIYHDDEEMSAKEASISIVRGIGILIHNKYWIIITIFGVLMNIVYAVVMAAPIYYAQVIVGNQNFYSTVNTVNLIPSAIGFVTVSWIIRRCGLAKTAKYAALIGTAGAVLRFFFSSNPVMFLVTNAIITYATIPLISVLPAMVMNTAEVNMQKYGVCITGMTNASNSFVGKIGSGLGGSAIGWILAAGGYDAYAATGEATGKVIGAVNVLNVYIPIAIFVVMALILFRYDLEEKLPEIRRENDRRMADHPAEN